MSLKNLPAEFAGSEMVVIAAVILGGVNPNASNYYRDFIWGAALISKMQKSCNGQDNINHILKLREET